MGCSSSAGAVCGLHEKYELGRKLGEGSFGQVHAVRRRDKSVASTDAAQHELARTVAGQIEQCGGVGVEEYAVKIVDRRKKNCEFRIWGLAGDHPHVVRLLEVFRDAFVCYAVMEKCEGPLLQAWERDPSAGESLATEMFRGMLLGVGHVHGLGIVHRDVKPDNFLLGGDDGQVVKLADYGLSALLPASGQLQDGIFGTVPFMAPEMLMKKAYGCPIDVWSLGVTCYLILYGAFPYLPQGACSKDAVKETIVTGIPAPRYRPQPDFAPSPPASAFVKELLERMPERRPTARACLDTPFLAESEPARKAGGQASMGPVVRLARACTLELAGRGMPAYAQLQDPTSPTTPRLRRAGRRPRVDPTSPPASRCKSR